MASRPLFRPVVRPGLSGVAAPFVYRMHGSEPDAEAATPNTWIPQPDSAVPVMAAAVAATGAPAHPQPENPDMFEEQRNKFAVDLSQMPFPVTPYPKSMTSLDVIAARLPALDERVKKHLWSPFVPDAFAPTEFLKDVPAPYGPKPKKYLELKNPHPWDGRVVFIGGLDGIDASAEDDTGEACKDEPHRYYINGSCANVMSVTTFLHAFFEPFDAVKQSESTFRTKTFADCKHRPSYKYYGCKSPEDIRAVWKRGARLGTMMHANLEAHFNGEPFKVCNENELPFQQFKRLFNDTDWVQWEPFRTEWSVFDPETLIAGQIDLAGMINKEHSELVLIDWKRAENISDSSFARFSGASQNVGGCGGHGPCRVLESCNFITYSLQLNTYSYLLQKNYGVKVTKLYILQFHPKNKDNMAGVFQCPNLMPIVEEMMACRKLVLRQHGIVT